MSNENQSSLPKSIVSEPKKSSSKRCSSSYRQQLKRIRTNCQLIRQRRRHGLFPVPPIELRSSVFQQRFYQIGSLELLNLNDIHWQSSNRLRLSEEYLYKCKYAMYSSTCRTFKQKEFYEFLIKLFSYSNNNEEEEEEEVDGALTRCQLCRNQFSSKDMLDFHFQRRSVSIEYRCLTCQLWIKSMNPCQAYSHLFSHSNNSKDKRIGQLNITYDWENSLTFIDDLFAGYSP